MQSVGGVDVADESGVPGNTCAKVCGTGRLGNISGAGGGGGGIGSPVCTYPVWL